MSFLMWQDISPSPDFFPVTIIFISHEHSEIFEKKCLNFRNFCKKSVSTLDFCVRPQNCAASRIQEFSWKSNPSTQYVTGWVGVMT